MTTAALVALPPELRHALESALRRESLQTLNIPWLASLPREEPLALIVARTATPSEDTAAVRRLTAAPLLIITDASPGDRATALALGADSCLRGDDAVEVVVQQAMALMRRSAAPDVAPARQVRIGNVRIDITQRRVTAGDAELHLAPREFDLLTFFLRHPNRVFRRHEILSAVWGSRWIGEPGTVDVHISWLRQKLPRDCGVRITTLRGVGYRLDSLAPNEQ